MLLKFWVTPPKCFWQQLFNVCLFHSLGKFNFLLELQRILCSQEIILVVCLIRMNCDYMSKGQRSMRETKVCTNVIKLIVHLVNYRALHTIAYGIIKMTMKYEFELVKLAKSFVFIIWAPTQASIRDFN